MLQRTSLRLGKIKSIEININITWLIVFGLLVFWLKNGYLAESAPHLKTSTSWIVSVIGAVVLFASVLTHELAHSLVALSKGLPIRKITLFIFGGVAHMEREPRTPGVEFRMAVAGPLASIGLAAVFAFLRFVILRGSPTAVPALVTEYGTYANLVLAGFNLVPGYPLDGGRVLRAILWKATRDFVRSTIIAAALGRAFGLLLVFIGVTLSVAWEAPGFLWLVLVGTFLERLAFLSAYRVQMMSRHTTADDGAKATVVTATPIPDYYHDTGSG